MIAAAALLCVGAAGDRPELPGWMAGCWEQQDGDRWTEECWTQPRGGVMLGAGRSGEGEQVGDWEATQILLDGARMDFWAAPKGENRTKFAWSPSAEPGVTFLNAGHDYPQRVRYWREGEALVAEVAMADGARPMRWRYRRVQ
jgi:hypothetical protein